MKEREYLGHFEVMVLLALLRLGDGAYGVPITQEIEKRSGRTVSVGSVYAALERLERKGVVTSHWGEPTAERGGRAKKYFRVTATGLKELRHTQKTLISLWQGLPELKGS
jgi:DNA-binding PadR family transcriptional regulator